MLDKQKHSFSDEISQISQIEFLNKCFTSEILESASDYDTKLT